MIYAVIFEPSPLGLAREFDLLWAESRHAARKKGRSHTPLFDYYYPPR